MVNLQVGGVTECQNLPVKCPNDLLRGSRESVEGGLVLLQLRLK